MLRLAVLAPLLPLVTAYEWYDVNNQPTSPWQKGQIGVSSSLSSFRAVWTRRNFRRVTLFISDLF
jgi:hypothetical protein